METAGIAQKYIFHFLSPNSYVEFFQYLRDKRLIENQSTFMSDLEDKLGSEG